MKKKLSKLQQEDAVISDLIRNNQLSDQHALLTALAKKGLAIPQPTLSRRLRKLGVAKVGGIYVLIGESAGGLTAGPVINLQIVPPNLIVVQTSSGSASFVAEQIDILTKKAVGVSAYADIAGTIAGDNTLLVVVKREASLEPVKQALEKAWGASTQIF